MRTFDLKLGEYTFPFVFVAGTGGSSFPFGENDSLHQVNIRDFYISRFPVTQSLWELVMRENPSHFVGKERPVECVSFIDAGVLLQEINSLAPGKHFRLPTETEWEYAAKGGKNWRDGFVHSGGNDIDEVAWYDGNAGLYSDSKYLATIKNHLKGTKTQDVGQKKPNQLGIFDMNGNVWEWCEDFFQRDTNLIPRDGSPCMIESDDRVLRGGCHHNGAIHCRVSNRYEIPPDSKDECIGFRLAFSPQKEG